MTGTPQFVVSVRIVVCAVFRCVAVALLLFAVIHGIFQIPGYNAARRMAATMTVPRPHVMDYFGVPFEYAAIGIAFFGVPLLVRRLVPCPKAACPGCGYDTTSNPTRCPECGLVLIAPSGIGS